jgi:arylformamidase
MTASSRVHDLTALLNTHMPVWPTSPLPVIEPVGIVARDGYSIERINCLTHTGTHMDAPFHFLENGATVDQIPAEKLVGQAAVLDLRHDLSGPLIGPDLVKNHWPKSFKPEIALFETGWSHRRAPTRQYLYEFPGLTPAAAEWVADQGVRGVGTDTLGIDPYSNADFEAHKVFLSRGVWILEALDHLDALAEERAYTLVAGPLKIAGGSGAMARVLALEP